MIKIDTLLSDAIESRFPGINPLIVQDFACSNGITSLDMYRLLSERRDVVVYATDYFDAIWIVRLPESGWAVVFNADSRPMQFVGKQFVISASHREPYKYPVNGVLRSWLMRCVLPRATQELENYRYLSGEDPRANSVVSRVRLFHPLCLEAQKVVQNFRLGQHDLFKASPTRSQVVRVMNALTPHHFSASRIKLGIRACLACLEPGGLFILGRSAEESHGEPRATAYEWDGEHLMPLWEVNGGYEWPELACSIGAVHAGACNDGPTH
jgi:hypothetical protein